MGACVTRSAKSVGRFARSDRQPPPLSLELITSPRRRRRRRGASRAAARRADVKAPRAKTGKSAHCSKNKSIDGRGGERRATGGGRRRATPTSDGERVGAGVIARRCARARGEFRGAKVRTQPCRARARMSIDGVRGHARRSSIVDDHRRCSRLFEATTNETAPINACHTTTTTTTMKTTSCVIA